MFRPSGQIPFQDPVHEREKFFLSRVSKNKKGFLSCLRNSRYSPDRRLRDLPLNLCCHDYQYQNMRCIKNGQVVCSENYKYYQCHRNRDTFTLTTIQNELRYSTSHSVCSASKPNPLTISVALAETIMAVPSS